MLEDYLDGGEVADLAEVKGKISAKASSPVCFLVDRKNRFTRRGKLRKPKVTLKMISGIKFLHFYEESS